MLVVLAMSEAWKTTLALIVIWFVALPLVASVLVGLAVARARGEKAENEAFRRHRGTSG